MVTAGEQSITKKAWQRFVEMGELMPGVRPIIARSWFRCKRYGLNPFGSFPVAGRPAPEDTPESRPAFCAGMTNDRESRTAQVIEPVLQRLYEWIGVPETMVLLADQALTVMACCGRLRPCGNSPLPQGIVLQLQEHGAFAPILLEEQASCCEVVGAEHYLACLHDYHSIAVKIPLFGQQTVLAVIAPCGQLGLQAKGLLLAAGEILQLELQYNTMHSTEKQYNLAGLERRAVIAALGQCSGNISHTARLLGISRNTLYNKMHKYGIEFANGTTEIR